jgi:four helix bundle protein
MAEPSERRRRTLRLQERTFAFTVGVIRACPPAPQDLRVREIWRQLVRAAMGVSGNLEEADESSSAREFVCKLKIALREAKEAKRWLRLLVACDLHRASVVEPLTQEAGELAAIFATIVLKVKRRISMDP